MSFIPERLYKQVVPKLPIICVDVVVKNMDGRILLVKRANNPARGLYWTPGGRINFNEDIFDAAKRKVREECGFRVKHLKLIGLTEDVFHDNAFGTGGTHTISFVFEGRADPRKIRLDKQSDGFKWAESIPYKPFWITPVANYDL